MPSTKLRYQKLKHLPKRELVEKALADDRARPLHGKTKICMFDHPMRRIENHSWFCDDPLCRVLVVHTGNLPGFYRFHSGTHQIVFCEADAEDYLQGRQSLKELLDSLLAQAPK